MLRSRKVVLLLTFLVLFVTSFQVLRQVMAQADVCLPLVEQAMAQVGNNCDTQEKNIACYGFNRVNATFNEAEAASLFTEPSDTSQINLFKAIETAPLNLPNNEWGIAVLRLQANLPATLPGQTTVFMLIGDSQVENAVAPEDALVADVVVTVRPLGDVIMRSAPDLNSSPIAQFLADTPFQADGISQDGEWLRVVQSEEWGWIERSAVEVDDAIDTLALIQPDAQTPMQAFVLSTSISDLSCEDAPNMLVIQGPKNTQIDLTANGADITLGSTIVLQTSGAPPLVLDANAPSVEVTATAFSPDRSAVATGYADGSIRIWDAVSGALLSTFQGSTQGITDLAYRPNTSILASTSLDGQVALWSGASQISTFEIQTQALSLAFSGDGLLLTVGGSDGNIYVWDLETGDAVRMLTGHSGAVNGLAALDNQLASAGADGSVRLWDLSTGASEILNGHTGGVNAVAFQPDGTRLASGGSDGTIHVWHLNAPGNSDILDSGIVTDLEYTADGRKLLSTGSDENVQLWTTTALEQRTPIRGLAAKATNIALSKDGYYLVGGSTDGTSRLWRITPDEMELAVIDGHAVVNGVTVPAGYSTRIRLDELGRAIVGDWSAPTLITVSELRPLSVVELFPDNVVNYPPELPPELVAMAGTATQIALNNSGTLVAGLPTNTRTPFPTSTGTVTPVPTTMTSTATSTPPTPTATATVPVFVSFSNNIWNDVNGNGLQDPGEGAVSGLPVELHVNPPYADTVTDLNGTFSFEAEEGTYFLKFFPPPGFTFGPSSGVNPATGETAPFTLQAGIDPPTFKPALKQGNPFTDISVDVDTLVDGVHESFDEGAVEGQEFQAQVVVSNVGGEWATDLGVTVAIPTDLVEVMGTTGALGVYDSVTGRWNIGTLPNGQSASLVFSLRIKPGTLREKIDISASLDTASLDQTDTSPDNNRDGANFTVVPGSDLSVVKTVDNPIPAEGDTVVYTLVAHNAGPQSERSVNVIESFPAGLTFVSADPSTGILEGGVWTFSNLAVGASETLTLTFTVDAGTDGTTISNTAEISGFNNDIHPDDNISGAAIEVGGTTAPQVADLDVHKSVTLDGLEANEGDRIRYSLQVTNHGPDDATSVVIFDTLPAGVTFDTSTGDGLYSLDGQWVVGDLANGATALVDIYVRINAGTGGTSIENTAAVGETDQVDPVEANNESSASFFVQIPPATADLVISKATNKHEATIGEQVIFTVAVANDGPADATGVVIGDLLPTSVTYVSHTPSVGTYAPGSGLWSVGNLPVGEVETLSIIVTVNSEAATAGVFNTAHVQSLDQDDPNSANDGAGAFVDVAAVDIAIEKEGDVTEAEVGDTVHFTVTVRNNGPLDATGVQIADIPEGLAVVSGTPSTGTYFSTTGDWELGNLANGAEETLDLTMTVLDNGSSFVFNQAELVHVVENDTNSSNNAGFAGITVLNDTADLSVNKSVDIDFPTTGEIVNFSVSVFNSGPADVTNVQVRDLLPSGLLYLSHTADSSYNPSTGVWVIGALADGGFVNLRIRARVAIGTQGALITNAAELLAGASLPDPDPDDNSDSATLTVQNPGTTADLSLEKTTFDTNPNEGDFVEFDITLTNNGPNVATDIRVQDLLPAGLTLLGGFGGGSSYDEATGVWAIDELANGDSVTLFIAASVNGGTAGTSITNTAAITSLMQSDPNSANNEDSVTLSVQDSQLLADLHITKEVDEPNAEVGDPLNFTIRVVNEGPNNALGVQVNDLLPAGLLYSAAFVGQGTYDPATGIWDVGTVPFGSTAQLSIDASPAAGTQSTTLTNSASVTSQQVDPDSSDNSASASVQVGAVVPANVDVSISTNANVNSASSGDNINIFVSAFNNGPDNATGVQVNALLPDGLEYVSHSSGDNYDPLTGIWSIGAIESERGASITITAQVTAPNGGSVTNAASLTHVDQTDSDASNDSSSDKIIIGTNLVLTQSVSADPVDEGEFFEFILTIQNNGSEVASNINLVDVLPSTVTFVQFNGSGNYVPSTGMLQLFISLAPGDSGVVSFVVSPNAGTAGTTITNTASVSASGVDDADPSDNSASASVSVENAAENADLEITKTVDEIGASPGKNVTFTITVTNNGPDNATGIQATDILPAGIVFEGTSSADYDTSTGIWDIGAVPTGGSVTLNIFAHVAANVALGTTITNTATLSADQVDGTPGNDSASVSLIVGTTDLSVSKTVSPPTPNEGANVTYTLTVSNNGPGSATGVVVTDLLPDDVTFASAFGSGSYDPAAGVWTMSDFDEIQVTGSRILTVQATVNSGTSGSVISNTAVLTALDQLDTNAGNNTDEASFTAGAAATQDIDLSLNKTVDNDAPDEGDLITYTVNVSNAGGGGLGAATGVQVRDLLPAGLIFESASVSRGVYDSASGIWNVGALANFNSATLTLRALVDAGTVGTTITNTAEVIAADQTDIDSTPNNGSGAEDDQGAVPLTVAGAPTEVDLTISKGTSDFNVAVGDTFTYTIFVSNFTASGATGVQVTDILPDNVTLVSATATRGSYSAGIWNIGVMSSSSNEQLELEVTVDETDATEISNTARITAMDQDDPDESNNTSEVTISVERRDVQVSVSAFPMQAAVDDEVGITVAVTNVGTAFMNSVVISNPIPAGTTLVSADPSQGSYNASSGLWTIQFLNEEETVFLDLVVKANAEGGITDTASLSSSEPVDNNTGNNSGSVTVPVAAAAPLLASADVGIRMLASDAEAVAGTEVTFVITATNSGADAATNVHVRVGLASGLTYVSHSGDGSYDPATSIWSVDTLADGASARLNLVVLTDISLGDAAFLNRAQLIALDQIDPVVENNIGTVTITITTLETPTVEATVEVTSEPTVEATEVVTSEPTTPPAESTAEITVTPTETPTDEGTVVPSETPTDAPTDAPTDVPTDIPTAVPPTDAPTDPPTEVPTESAAAKRPFSDFFAMAGLGLIVSLPLAARRKRR